MINTLSTSLHDQCSFLAHRCMINVRSLHLIAFIAWFSTVVVHISYTIISFLEQSILWCSQCHDKWSYKQTFGFAVVNKGTGKCHSEMNQNDIFRVLEWKKYIASSCSSLEILHHGHYSMGTQQRSNGKSCKYGA